ncbi:MAG: MFS transporter [Actinobacteria bacterium]|nr:MFS transporter [Actinomycetota bacterium]MDA3017268.1 MFS transporter [Actinomycetota bacterium]
MSRKPRTPALTARQRTILWLLALACVPATYANTLFTQTVAYAAQDFAISEQGQGIGAAIIRWGVVISLPLAALADRIGRRRLIIFCAFGAPIITALGGLAPSFAILVATQTLGRPLALVLTILIGIVATEEMSRESRAWAISVLAIAAGFGAGFALAALPLADLGADSWRYIYAISLAWVVIAIILLRKLPETTRFTERRETHLDLATHIDKTRLATQSLVAIFGNLFIAASSVFQVRYLRDVRDYSAAMVTAFTLVTGTPASIGLLIGGRIADARGRRMLSAVTFPLGAILLTAAFSTSGQTMWLASVSGGICLGLAYPAMAVYRGEMFPTLHRSFASSVIMTASLIGGSVGLVGAGYALNRDLSYSTVMSWLSLGPIVAGILVYATFPESAHRELEELNPQDVVGEKPVTAQQPNSQ